MPQRVLERCVSHANLLPNLLHGRCQTAGVSRSWAGHQENLQNQRSGLEAPRPMATMIVENTKLRRLQDANHGEKKSQNMMLSEKIMIATGDVRSRNVMTTKTRSSKKRIVLTRGPTLKIESRPTNLDESEISIPAHLSTNPHILDATVKTKRMATMIWTTTESQ